VHALIIEREPHIEENRKQSEARQEGDVRARCVLAAVVVLGWTVLAQSKDMALISNKGNSVGTITLPDLVKVCKGQTSRWPDGKPVSFITRDPALPDMKMVLEKIYGMSKEDLKAAVASANHGRAEHPAIIVVESDDAVVKRVESTPGAIGLVDVYSISGGVTVLKVGGKLPLEPGYPLHGN
jgi:ABC-type phosphate transport system substrate-binding protein